MGKMPTFKELISLKEEEVIRLYETDLNQFSATPSFWLDELIRREKREHNKTIRKYTKTLKNYTRWTMILTAFIAGAVIFDIVFHIIFC